MLFRVYRTSCFGGSEGKPCENAIFNREEDWVVEINSLEELLKLIEEQDEDIIIKTKRSGYPFQSIEIYDDYRE